MPGVTKYVTKWVKKKLLKKGEKITEDMNN